MNPLDDLRADLALLGLVIGAAFYLAVMLPWDLVRVVWRRGRKAVKNK